MTTTILGGVLAACWPSGAAFAQESSEGGNRFDRRLSWVSPEYTPLGTFTAVMVVDLHRSRR